MRKIIFEKSADKDHTWMTCDTWTKQLANGWWVSENGFRLPGSGKAEEMLESEEYESIKQYATMKAGENLIRI
jgi:hypothetical protein